jgi:hypothetical protein
MPHPLSIRVALVAAFASAPAGAQTAPSVALEGVDGAAALDALAQECYEGGLTPDLTSAEVLDCSRVIEERLLAGAPDGEERFVVSHTIRFTLLGRAAEARVRAEAWTETEELGSVIEQAITSPDYLGRAQRVLRVIVARLRSRATPPWAGRYESEQAWHLDAHLKAVSQCDSNLASMTSDSVAAELRSIGLYPLDDDTRDLCEQLQTHLFEWALARGDSAPTVAAYARERAALPPDQRVCTGQLAPDATCPP